MHYNIFDTFKSVDINRRCVHDTKCVFKTDFSVDGDVDGFNDYYGVHTYGCFNNFLFGTIFYDNAYIGRSTPFAPIDSSIFYIIKISIKIKSSIDTDKIKSKLSWRTLSNPVWLDSLSKEFYIHNDGLWHDYIINMGEVYNWQGDINDLRLYPMLEWFNGDSFYIKNISIESNNEKVCNNDECSYSANYSSPCYGIGSCGYIKSKFIDDDVFYITDDNDLLLINIDDYGYEHIYLGNFSGSGNDLAKLLRDKISELSIGGYSFCNVIYDGSFKICSGTYNSYSSVKLKFTKLSLYIGFFNENKESLYSYSYGSDPASGYSPVSTFQIPINKITSLFKSNKKCLEFNPNYYMINGGRSDWLSSGVGSNGSYILEGGSSSRNSNKIYNYDTTLIDLCHPFNSNGKISIITAQATLKNDDGTFLTGAKFIIFRPHIDGSLSIIHKINIQDIIDSDDYLYSVNHEHIEEYCNIIINKGDLLGIYNAHLYVGKTLDDGMVDALYYKIDGEPEGKIKPGSVYGQGSSGLLINARSEIKQSNLSLDIDMGHRINIEKIDLNLKYADTELSYNIARCLDINWSVNLFGGSYNTGYSYDNNDGTFTDYDFVHESIAYGIDKLSDGVKITNNGLVNDTYTSSHSTGVVVPESSYFYVNGDEEWLSSIHHSWVREYGQYVSNFKNDPIAFDIIFPYNSSKKIYKSNIYFKENFNFRSFGLQYYDGDPYNDYTYISKYKKVIVDNVIYEYDGDNYSSVDLYLFSNPNNGDIDKITYDGDKWDGENLGIINNNDQNIQSLQIDWTYLSHEFDPVYCNGFRFLCTYHESTKINEMELYCFVDDGIDNVVGSIYVDYSYYDDYWESATIISSSDLCINAFIGDTPRYINLNINPFTTISINNIDFYLSDSNIHIGDKGCEDIIYLDNNKIDSINKSNKIKLKNIYENEYDLYVDIPSEVYKDETGLILYSKMNNKDSLSVSEIGPDCNINSRYSYDLLNADNNCAINCECFSLNNLIVGKDCFISYDNIGWKKYKNIDETFLIDYSNIPEGNKTELNFPRKKRSKYWKIVHDCEDSEIIIREIIVFSNGEKIIPKFYYDDEVDKFSSIVNDAPHLGNGSVTGSYYINKTNNYIGMEFDSPIYIDKIIIYHDSLNFYEVRGFGVDAYTNLCLKADNKYKGKNFYDYSYNEHEISYIGDGVYSDGGINKTEHNFYENFESDINWYFSNNYDSYYTSSSGVLDFNLVSAASFNDYLSYEIPKGYILSKHSNFELSFSILLSSDNAPNNGICVGIHDGSHYTTSYVGGHSVYPWYGGITLLFLPAIESFSFVVRSKEGQYASMYMESDSASGCQYDVEYSCIIKYYSYGYATCEIYDDYLYGNSVASFYLSGLDYINWNGYYVGLGSSDSRSVITYDPVYTKGYLKEFNFISYIITDKIIFDKRPISFDGKQNSVLKFKSSDKFEIKLRTCTIDFWLLLNDIPENNTVWYFVKNMYGVPDEGTAVLGGWYCCLQNIDNNFYIRLVYTKDNGAVVSTIINYNWKNITVNRWYFISIERDVDQSVWNLDADNRLFIDGAHVYTSENRYWRYYVDVANQDLEIGRNFNGCLFDFRISMCEYYEGYYSEVREQDYVPSYEFNRLYTYNFYTSDDNIVYGKSFSLSAYKESRIDYYDKDNKYNVNYNNYLLIDLKKNYYIDFIRNYGGSNLINLDFLHNAIYGDNSNDIDNVVIYDGEDRNLIYDCIECIDMDGNIIGMDVLRSTTSHVRTDVHRLNNPWIGFRFSADDKKSPNRFSFISASSIDSNFVHILQGSNDSNKIGKINYGKTL